MPPSQRCATSAENEPPPPERSWRDSAQPPAEPAVAAEPSAVDRRSLPGQEGRSPESPGSGTGLVVGRAFCLRALAPRAPLPRAGGSLLLPLLLVERGQVW